MSNDCTMAYFSRPNRSCHITFTEAGVVLRSSRLVLESLAIVFMKLIDRRREIIGGKSINGNGNSILTWSSVYTQHQWLRGSRR